MNKIKKLFFLASKYPFFLSSIVLHLVGLLAILQISTHRLIENISIEVLQRTVPQKISKVKSHSIKSSAEKAKSQSTASLKSKKINPFLFKSYLENSGTIADSSGKSTHSSYNGNSEWKESYFYLGDGMTDYNDISTPNVQFLQSFWQQVEINIENNPFLSEYGHVGTVFFQFNLNEKGELINETLKVSSMDSVLKVIAIRAIRKALLEQKFSLPEKQVTLGMKFTWDSYETCPTLKGIHSYYLSFCHYAEYKMNRFTGTEKAQKYMSSLAYGFGAIDEIKKYNQEEYRRNTRFDPFEKYKNDPDWYL